MSFNIKNSREVSPVLGFVLVVVTILLSSIVFSHLSSFQSLTSLVNPHNQTAQVSGASGSVYHLPSCPSSKSLYTEMFDEFNSRISGVTVPPNATTDVNRDTAFLQSWAAGLDFSGHSLFSADGNYGYTLISPRHAYTAWHINGYGMYLGQKVTFYGKDGVGYTRSVAGIEQIGTTDIALVVFDSDLPPTVAYYPLISGADLSNFAPAQLPVVFLDQLGDYLVRKAEVSPAYGIFSAAAYSSNSSLYPFGLELDVHSSPQKLIPDTQPGDSGHPNFFIVGNALIAISEGTGNGAGVSVGAFLGTYIPQINQAMLDLDKNLTNPTNSYQVTTLDMSCFSPYVPASIPSQSFTVDQSAPNGTVVGKVAYAGTNISSITRSFSIYNSGTAGGIFAIDASGQITVANSFSLAHSSASNNGIFNLGITMTETWPAPDDQSDNINGQVTINVSKTSPAQPPVQPPVNNNPSPDVTAPVVTAFTIPATVASLTIPITTLTATDPIVSGQITSGVTGYIITESVANSANSNSATSESPATRLVAGAGLALSPGSSGNTPSATVSGWSSTAPTTYTFSSAGAKTLYAYAKDAAGNVSVSKSASVTVTLTQPNNPPTLSVIGNKSVNENSNLSFTVFASDPDKDPLSYSASNLPTGATFTASTRTFSWTPTYTQSGNYQVTFIVTDSHGATDSKTITITVINVDRAPVANAGSNQTVTLPAAASLSAAASSDPDNDPLTYSWLKISGPGTVIFSNSGSISPTATFSQSGTYSLQVSVSDGTLSSTDQTTVTANLVPATIYTLTSSASSNGSIVPNGAVTVNSGSNQTFTITPNVGYQTASVIVDGTSVGAATFYTFSNITANHTISVTFTANVVNVVDTTPPSLISITTSNMTTNSSVISWTTNEAATSQVKYGLTNAYGNTTAYISTLAIYHTVTLTNLSPNTIYHYAIISTDASGNTSVSGDGTFSTLPIIQPQITIPIVNTPPVNIIPAVIPVPVTALTPTPAYAPSSVTTYTQPTIKPTNPVLSYSSNSSTTDQTYQLTLPSSTPSDIQLITPPSLPVFLLSYITDHLYSFPAFLQYISERIVIGVEKTFGLPSNQ